MWQWPGLSLGISGWSLSRRELVPHLPLARSLLPGARRVFTNIPSQASLGRLQVGRTLSPVVSGGFFSCWVWSFLRRLLSFRVGAPEFQQELGGTKDRFGARLLGGMDPLVAARSLEAGGHPCLGGFVAW